MMAGVAEALRSFWPLAGIGVAVVINGVWIAALGYGFWRFL
jgi:hypothetical protein